MVPTLMIYGRKRDPYVTYWNVTISPAVNIYRPYDNAEERCHGYFEDEYGTDGEYEEHYYTLELDRYGNPVRKAHGGYILEQSSRRVYKTTQVPRALEDLLLRWKLIDDMQQDEKAVVKERNARYALLDN